MLIVVGTAVFSFKNKINGFHIFLKGTHCGKPQNNIILHNMKMRQQDIEICLAFIDAIAEKWQSYNTDYTNYFFCLTLSAVFSKEIKV